MPRLLTVQIASVAAIFALSQRLPRCRLARRLSLVANKGVAGSHVDCDLDAIVVMTTAPRTLLRLLYCGVVAMCFPQQLCVAQQRSQTSFDVNIGLAFGASSAHFSSSAGVSADALLGVRPKVGRASGLVVALSGSMLAHGVREGTPDCVPNVVCLSKFPTFAMFSILGGWEFRTGGARLLIGPAIAREHVGERIGRSSTISAGALQTRLDMTRPMTKHVSLLASGRFNYLPKFDGDAFYLTSFGVGLRIRQ